MEERNEITHRQALALEQELRAMVEKLNTTEAEWLTRRIEMVASLASRMPEDDLIWHPKGVVQIKMIDAMPRPSRLKELDLLPSDVIFYGDNDRRLFPAMSYRGPEVANVRLCSFLFGNSPSAAARASLEAHGQHPAVADHLISFAHSQINGTVPWLERYPPCVIVGLGQTSCFNDGLIAPALVSPGKGRRFDGAEQGRWYFSHVNYFTHNIGCCSRTWFMTVEDA